MAIYRMTEEVMLESNIGSTLFDFIFDWTSR